MPDIASSDVTYTQQSKTIEAGYSNFVMKVEFGDGALTYPSGGVPLLKASLGVPNEIRAFNVIDPEASDGLVYKYDFESNKIRIYEGDYAQAGDAPLVELDSGSDTPAATDLFVEVRGW